jgi:hypothetical protein
MGVKAAGPCGPCRADVLGKPAGRRGVSLVQRDAGSQRAASSTFFHVIVKQEGRRLSDERQETPSPLQQSYSELRDFEEGRNANRGRCDQNGDDQS